MRWMRQICVSFLMLSALAGVESLQARGKKKFSSKWTFKGRIKLEENDRIAATPGVAEYTAHNATYADGKFAVCVPASYSPKSPMPLVVSSHGAGGTGKGEVGQWKKWADQYGFIVVCPSYACAAGGRSTDDIKRLGREDTLMLYGILRRVFGSLKVDRKHVLHTGFSGGGRPTWYIAMAHPECFTAVCFRSANFHCPEFIGMAKLRKWRTRPVYMFWGEQDHPIILHKGAGGEGEGPAGLKFLRTVVARRKLKHEVIPGGKHTSRADLAAKWFAEEVVAGPGKAAK